MSQTQLVITLLSDGTVQVNGPIDNKLLCYGLLDCAKDAIREFKARKSESGIAVPRLVVPGKSDA